MLYRFLTLAAFGLNTDIYSVNLRIQSECGKIRTRKYSVFGQFSRSGRHHKLPEQLRRFNNLHLKGDYSEKLKSFS